ncbi:hypothetical protein E4T50_06492 [Aureobasidium sp. EXF-12298]|nr:hypothetical protein E4T50_06492 [Aureobasidium sp. EXF-12298]KAI4764848.1 hypothetical protein E4T51_02128 [Aureobasidium sp. EXF-12344]KAI4781205.1 hypothetical protein E4T52_03869 [Aureobasidium sp. EXF-3400]
MTRAELLSLAVPIWQWWRREQPSMRKDQHGSITNIRIMHRYRESNPTENVLRLEVWKMSLVPDVSLSRSVQKLSTSDIDGSFKNSTVEFSHEFENLRPGFDQSLRSWALMFLKNTIGWIDSSGSLLEGEYPELASLIHNAKGEKPSSVDSQSFSLETSVSPGPQRIPDSEELELHKDRGEKAVAVSSPVKTDEAKHATARGTQEGRGENSWRAKSRDDLKHEYHRKPSLVYVFPEASESSFDIEIFRKEPDWFEQPMTRFKLYHTLPAVGCLYVNFRTLPETVLNRRKLDLWKSTLLNTFRSSLKNHIGPVDQAGVLRKSKQPTINQFLYELKTPTNLYLSAGTEVMESPKERYVPQSSIDTRQVEKGLEAPKLSMYNQIENVMKLAGDLYEVSKMLNEEISNNPSHPNENPVLDTVDANWMNEPNPVLKTRKHGKINVDAVKRAILKLKAQLRDHEGKARILAHICQRWKAELEVEYPLMKRGSASQSGMHNLAIPSSEPSRTKSSVTKEKTPTGPQGPAKYPKIRHTHSPDKRNVADDNEFSISPF